jgi:Integral peroxisomal membrane peroxin
MRAIYRQAIRFISGSYSVPLVFSKFKASTTKVEPEPEKTVKHHRFLFTVLENQRWWVGIDWTAALLPSERPSWCAPTTATSLAQAAAGNHAHNSAIHPPLPPPSTFPLPPSTSVILPSPGSGYVKRTAKWQWEDGGEWEVVIHREGESASKRFRPPSISKSPQIGGTGTAAPEPEEGRGSRFLKGQLSRLSLGAVTSSTAVSSAPPPTELAVAEGDEEKAKALSEDDEDLVTDPEGWIYGDNKWENLSGKGGMGKVCCFCPK